MTVQTPETTETRSPTWAELVAENEHLPELMRVSLESALNALRNWEASTNARTELCADAALSGLARFLVPLNRGSSITRQRLSEHVQPDVQRREAEQAKAKAEQAKKRRAAVKKAKAKAANAPINTDIDIPDIDADIYADAYAEQEQ